MNKQRRVPLNLEIEELPCYSDRFVPSYSAGKGCGAPASGEIVPLPIAGQRGSKEPPEGFFNSPAGTAEANRPLRPAFPGREFELCCQDADGIKATADGTDTIRDLATVSTAGGTIASTALGAYIKGRCYVLGQWTIIVKTGAWTVST